MLRRSHSRLSFSDANPAASRTIGVLDGYVRKGKEETMIKEEKMVKQQRHDKVYSKDKPWYRYKDFVYAWAKKKEYTRREIAGVKERPQLGDMFPMADKRQFMNAEDAAEVLGVKKVHIWEGSLTSEMIVEAFDEKMKEVRKSNPWSEYKINTMRREYTMATEVLEEYLNSAVQKHVQGVNIQGRVNNIAKEVTDTLDDDKNWWYEMVARFYLMGIASVAAVLGSWWLYLHLYYPETVKVMMGKTVDHTKLILGRKPQSDPAPDYRTRYANTPTSLDLHQMNNAGHQASTARELAAIKHVEEINRVEDEFLTRIFVDAELEKRGEIVNAPARKAGEVSHEEKMTDMMRNWKPDAPSIEKSAENLEQDRIQNMTPEERQIL